MKLQQGKLNSYKVKTNKLSAVIRIVCVYVGQVCLNFDFRKIPGEYTEYSIKSIPIDDTNLRAKAELLLNQYGRTGSLFPHNVVLMLLGDDCRYEHDIEWEQQYHNYKVSAS